jgi:hypothetical protein
MTALLAAALLAADPAAVELVFTDPSDRTARLSSLRGGVAVLVYGDRKGTDECRKLGEALHVAFHPTAKGKPPAEARTQPVLPTADGRTPAVHVVPVACCGKVPNLVRGLIRTQIKAGAGDVPVWLDFDDTMKTHFGITAGRPNVAVFDAAGRLRHTATGAMDEAKTKALVEAIRAVR